MPVYQATCVECEVEADYTRSIADCMDTPPCPICGVSMKKVIRTAPRGFVTGKFDPFVSTVDGSIIHNARELKAHNERNNVVNLNDGWSEESIKAGACAPKPEKVDTNLKQDIAEAISAVKSGYKPNLEVHDGQ